MKIHVGASGSHSTEVFRQNIAELKKLLISSGIEIVDGEGWEDRPFNVYLAIVDYPSTVVGEEIRQAMAKGIPAIVCAHQDAKLHWKTERSEPLRTFYRYFAMLEDVPGFLTTMK